MERKFKNGESVTWVDANHNTRTGYVVEDEYIDHGYHRVRVYSPPVAGSNSGGYRAAPHVERVGRAPMPTAEPAATTAKPLRSFLCYRRGLDAGQTLVIHSENPVRAAELYVDAFVVRKDAPMAVLVRELPAASPGTVWGVTPFDGAGIELRYRVRYTPGAAPLITYVDGE